MSELKFDVLGNLQLVKKKIEAQITNCQMEPVETCQKCGKKLKHPRPRAWAFCQKCNCPMRYDIDCQNCGNGSKVMLGDGSVDDVFCMISERSQEANYQADNDRCDWCKGPLNEIERNAECGPTLERFEIVSSYGMGEEYEIEERIDHFCTRCYNRFLEPTMMKIQDQKKFIQFFNAIQKMAHKPSVAVMDKWEIIKKMVKQTEKK